MVKSLIIKYNGQSLPTSIYLGCTFQIKETSQGIMVKSLNGDIFLQRLFPTSFSLGLLHIVDSPDHFLKCYSGDGIYAGLTSL